MARFSRTTALGFALACAAAGCRFPQSTANLSMPLDLGVPDGGVSSSTLASGDFLEVRVYQEQDLSGAFRVSPDGFIDFPLCGKVRVAGLTPSQCSTVLTDCLANGFLRRPQVVVLVKEFNSKKIFVFGDVSKPGAFAYEDGMTIVQALSDAGGFNKTASKNSVNVVRVVDGKEVKVPVKVEDIITGREKNFSLLPGDIVFVPEGFF
jgi:polysaccharide export outer membrane protein